MAKNAACSRRALRVCILGSVAFVALPAHAADTAPVASGTTPAKPVQPLYGNIRSFYGNIRSFSGDVNPFYGNIRSFWGDVSPFEGDLTAFWGNIRSFSGTSPDGVTPAWGNIRSFWGDIGPAWGNIRSFWGNIRSFDAAPQDYASLATQLNGLVIQSEGTWGAAVRAKTGKSFQDGFASNIFVKYGINLNDPKSLQGVSEEQRTLFFLDWYDGLMEFSGVDHVDHWMKTVNWNPALTVTQGEGRRSVIGLLDFSVNDAGTQKAITQYDGTSSFSNGHGAAVASLMVAAHDGKGVMGIAPMATVLAYNPFDSSGTAGWSDITNGVLKLSSSGASIINLSLGVPGWTLHQGWNDVFSNAAVAAATKSSVFVMAAGNDGISQTQSIAWNFATNPSLIVVGSVDPNGQISSFSNTPGNACLLDNGVCKAGNELKNRFIVASGELILVADDKGGVTRRSGTSFAAPLVSGTIALIQNRWPWLANFPKETVDIVLKSAKDLGAPGVDEVYGAGLLDVTAANSPLNFNNLVWYSLDPKGNLKLEQATKIRSSTDQKKWEDKGMFFYAYEDVGGTFRDFAIPLSSKLIGQTALSAGGSREQFQQYLYSRMTDWMNSAPSTGAKKGFASFAEQSSAVYNPYGFNLTMSLAPRTLTPGFKRSNVPYQTSLRLAGPDDKFAMRMGFGDGAVALGGHEGFGLVSDYDSEVGGANPLLGMASGGGYANVDLALSGRLRVAAGITQRTLKRDLVGRGFDEQVTLGRVAPYEAGAQTVTARYQVNRNLMLIGGYTRLREASGLLGVQSLDPADFDGGSTTNGATLGVEAQITSDLSLSLTGTVGRTSQSSTKSQNIAVGKGGLVSTAFELGVSKNRILDNRDRARLTLSQPMFLEQGSLDLTQIRVVNRQTGELGPVTQSFDVSQARRQFVAEMLYGRALMNNTAEMSLFGRAQIRPGATSQDSAALMAGTRFRMNF